MSIRSIKARSRQCQNIFSVRGGWVGGVTAYLGGATAYLVGGATAYLGGATAYLVGGWEDEFKNKTNLSQSWS